MYGLDTISVNTKVKNSLDAFHMKGLRKIMRLPSTYLFEHRHFTNEYVLTRINDILHRDKKSKPVMISSDYHRIMRIKRLAKLLHFGDADPAAKATMNFETWESHDAGTRRSGQPRKNWLFETMRDMWNIAKNDAPTSIGDLVKSSPTHRNKMLLLSTQIIIEKKTIS